jgi:hypothetical protein
MPIKSFQIGVSQWLVDCLGVDCAMDTHERNHRFLEEALELVQSKGCTASEAHQLVDYVFNRPVGEPVQEVGGVMVTLAALCTAADIDLATSADDELRRIWTKVPEIRAKHGAKPKHSPLPETATDYRGNPVDPTYLLVRDPAFWARAESDAWHRAIPDVRKAFQDLARATPSSTLKFFGVDVADGVSTTVRGHVDAKGNYHIDDIQQEPVPSVEETANALCLVGDTEHITDEAIVTWTDAQRQEAFDWAIALHYRASDNDDVEVPQRPTFTIAASAEATRG